ncbi:Predicted Zn-dependent peptidase [Halobacillus karajensis]|uniref:Zinc protease AlbF n=1 Tax=Halobacillus karajensis TaxID=195088 RepID=A0A024P1V8_9BACI|nr:pitrilysin family protein [Halobacillus karajensis]CDQ19680.1 Putative zinc protease AlbF [Halobacillus karajensis]CDQ22140.1 Putative zinc protease AlbF [Halobacillus karajensis]CDQ27981.1 Putative zinc protease AlbF [Halobacillus karajensis]SEH73950.1 Predicted Zn-dependent peptidase [Halobacillus karajensis]
MEELVYTQLKETVYQETMDNGLKVFLLSKPEMAKTFGIFTTNYGSIDQTFTPIGKDEKVTVPEGIAHFLEHKLFEKEDRDVFQDFTRLGASANAFTSFTKTAYLFSATSQIEKNVQTLLDFVQDPYFSEESVEKEKGIIAQEIRMYDDQPDWRSFFGTIQSLYHNHPVKVDIAGTVDSIQNITKDDLYTCYETFYHPSNMVLFIAGNFDPESMMALVRENQSKKEFPDAPEINRSYPDEPTTVAKKDHTITMPVTTAKAMVGVKENVNDLTGEELVRGELLSGMILDYYFSRSGVFYEELYKNDLIDDSFQFETELDREFGFTILGGDSRKPDEMAARIKEMLHELKDKRISDEDFTRMKRKKIGQFMRAMNSLEFIANQFTHYHTLGTDLFEVLPIIESLTADDAEEYLQHWLKEDAISVFQIKPQTNA